MGARNYQKNFTVDGQYVIDPSTGSDASQINITGSTGGGAVRVGFISRAGSFIPYQDEDDNVIDLQPDRSIVLTHGKNVELAISVVGSTAAQFTVFRAEVN